MILGAYESPTYRLSYAVPLVSKFEVPLGRWQYRLRPVQLFGPVQNLDRLASHQESDRCTEGLAHKRAMQFFAAIGQENPSHRELCQQRGAFFYQHRCRVGVACAQACALRIGGAAPPRRQAPLQGADAHALQSDLDAHWGG